MQYVISARNNLEVAQESEKVSDDDNAMMTVIMMKIVIVIIIVMIMIIIIMIKSRDLDGNICVPPLARTDDAKVASANLLQIPYFQP